MIDDYLNNLKDHLDKLDRAKIQAVAELLLAAYKRRATVYVIGNGGSAATASHLASDLAKTVRGHKGDSSYLGFRSIALSDNVPLITAWANDVGFETVYSGQLENLGEPGDILIAISSSGNSPNILAGVKTAKKLKMKAIGIAGFGGGKLAGVSDLAIVTSASQYGPVEDIQMILVHLLTAYFQKHFHGQK